MVLLERVRHILGDTPRTGAASRFLAGAMVLAIPLAYKTARLRRSRLTSVLESLIILPLVLPPTVLGYLLISFAGARGCRVRGSLWRC